MPRDIFTNVRAKARLLYDHSAPVRGPDGKNRAFNTNMFNVVLAAYAACGWKVRGACQQQAYLISCYIARDWKFCFHVKAQCNLLRKYSLTGEPVGSNLLVPWHRLHRLTRDEAWQLSLVARSLPAPKQSYLAREELRFVETATTPRHQPFVSTNRFDALAKYLVETDPTPQAFCEPGTPGGSSCFSHTRSQGGSAAAFAAELHPDDRSALSSHDMGGRARARRKNALKRSLADFSKKKLKNVMRPIAIGERGCKARLVTCSDPHIVSRAHSERRRLWRIILRIPQISRHLGKPAARIRLDPYGSVVSTDMSKATDCFSHEALSWFCLQFNIDPSLVYSGFGVQPEGEDCVLDYARGAPMGMPCTWAILSLIHYMILRHVNCVEFAIRGDDAICRLGPQHWIQYRVLCQRFGLEINEKKTFLSSDRGTFCERMYTLVGDTLHLQPSMSLRIFNPEDKVGALRDSYSAGKDSLLPPDKVYRIFQYGMPWAFFLAKKYKVPKHLPTYYGGLGLPPRGGSRCTRRMAGRLRWIDTHGVPFPVILSVSGSAFKKLQLDKLKFSVSTSNPCYHFDRIFTDTLNVATIQSIADGTYREFKLSPHKYLTALRKRWLSVPVAPCTGRRRYEHLYDRELLVSATSMEEVFGHKSLNDSCSIPPDHVSEPVYRTTHLLF
uniref:RNA-dependent RNA polymerase n=1 Tax=Plasmopara viticola lesion associated narnavirus 18 TaxID=2719501 RepID=A0A6G9RTE5_9VIRU|nr:RNA-dependent RNA polymerase [Plasmopara viticola lesion associated narnavirus 18]